MGHGDGVVVVGQTVTVMALMDRSQFGILLGTQGRKFLVTSVQEARVFLLPFAPELMLLCLGRDELQDPSRRGRQLTVAASLRLVLCSTWPPCGAVFSLTLSLIQL